jgi:hypothetical protein
LTVSDLLNGERRREPWWAKGLVPLVVSGFAVGLIAWGANTYAVADQGRRIEKLELLVETIADLRAQVRFLVRAEELRQARDARRDTP